MLKRLVIFTALVLTTNTFADTRPSVPSPSMGKMNQHRGNCKVPEFLVNIPPMMQNDYVNCINERFRPSETLVDVVLKQHVSK
jgi:hypothetical protein